MVRRASSEDEWVPEVAHLYAAKLRGRGGDMHSVEGLKLKAGDHRERLQHGAIDVERSHAALHETAVNVGPLTWWLMGM